MTSPLVLVPKEKLVTSTNSFSLAPVRMEACTAAPYDTTSSGLTESQILRAPNMSDSRALTCSQITLRQLHLEIAAYHSLQEAKSFMDIWSELHSASRHAGTLSQSTTVEGAPLEEHTQPPWC